MTDDAASTITTFKRLVISSFSKRPTLRAVLAEQGFRVLVDRYPMIAGNYPQLASLDEFSILHTSSVPENARQSNLLDALLAQLLTGQPLQLAAKDALSIAPPLVFRAQKQGVDSARQPQINLDPMKLNSDFEHVLNSLPEAFAQAQISFWNGFDEYSDTSRLQGLALIIKAALLNNIPRQSLDAGDADILYAMLDGAGKEVNVCAVQVTFAEGDRTCHRLLPDLLLNSTQNSSQRVLWCKPSGIIRGFANLTVFAATLQDELAEHYRFDRLFWAKQPLTEAPQAFQATQLLNAMLADLKRLSLAGVASVGALERLFADTCDPSRFFLDQPCQVPGLPAIMLPTWLEQADAKQRFDYHAALLDLAASQGQARGSTSLGDIEDVQRYTRRRLCEQLQLSHPGKTPYDPDQTFIIIHKVLASSMPGQPQSLYLREETLTALAISRLQPGEVMTRIGEAHGQPYTGWLNIRHVETLIRQVDIGGAYPTYVKTQINARQRKAERIAQYAREWRECLRFNVLKASIEGQLAEAACKTLLGFCAGAIDVLKRPRIAPLAFHSALGSSASDRAHGMFLIELPGSQGWVLYRPFHSEQSLLQFSSLDLLMDDVRGKPDLQQSVLDSLDDSALAVYENDGFNRPHLHAGLRGLAHLLSPETALTATVLENLRQPVRATFKAWPDNDLDSQLLDARVDAMLHMASRRSVSNAQLKWVLVRQAAWAIFNTVTLLWRGPLAGVTWLVLALSAAKDDIDTLANGTEDARIMAATDLLTNLAMLLATRGEAAVATPERPSTLRFTGPAERGLRLAEVAEPAQQHSWEKTVHEQQHVHLGDVRWGNRQRLDNLPAERRQALRRLQARLSLQGHAPLSKGRLRGLYKVDGQLYVKLDGAAYEVQESWDGVRIVGPDTSKGDWVGLGGTDDGYHIVGRARVKGPWVSRWNGEWSITLNLAGGSPVKTPDKAEYMRLTNHLLANEPPLKERDRMINSNLVSLQALDRAEIDYSRAATEYRKQLGHDVPGESSEMATIRARRDTLRAEHADTIKAACRLYEERVPLLQSNIELIDLLKTPALQRFSTVNYQAEIGLWYETLITSDTQLYSRLLSQVSYDDINAQAATIVKLPATPAQRDAYAAYRTLRDGGLAVHRRILAVSQRLDDNIAVALEDPRIVYPNKASHLKNITESRPYSTLIVHAQILTDLQTLALDRAQLTGDSIDSMYQEQQNLRTKDMHQAMLSHDGVLRADASADDQIAILENSLQQYVTSLGTTEYLLGLNHPAWNSEYLHAYAKELSVMKRMAERALDNANARRDAEQQADWPTARPAPPPRPRTTPRAKLRVIRTTRHKTLLVDEALKDGKAVQYDPVARRPVAEFEAQGSAWVELQAQPGASQKALRSLGTRLVAETDGEIARARLFDDAPNSLTDVLDHHIEKLTTVVTQLERESSPALLENLNSAIERLQTVKRERLKTLYLSTRHPDSKALRFLLEQQLVAIKQTVIRRQLGPRDFLDVYTLYRTDAASSVILWEAHFHYTHHDSLAKDFAKGHLKFATAKTRDAQLEDALSPQERLKVYRGDLKYEQVKDLIPFPAG
ncbi:MAG: hypothetical protein ACN6OX_07805 [Pseudomonas sp.]